MLEKTWLKSVVIFFLILLGSIIIVLGSIFSYSKLYENKVYRGVYVSNYHLGGMTQSEVKAFIDKYSNRIIKEGIEFDYQDPKQGSIKINIPAMIQTADVSLQLINIDVDSLARRAVKVGRPDSNWFVNKISPFLVLFNKEKLPLLVEINSKFSDLLKKETKDYTSPVTNANLVVTQLEPLKFDKVNEIAGTYIDYDKLLIDLEQKISSFSYTPVVIDLGQFKPNIVSSDLDKAVKKLKTIFSYGDISLSYVDTNTKLKKEWLIKANIYKDWLILERDDNDNIIFTLDKEKIAKYLESLAVDIDKQPVEAKFTIENGKVKEFQASKNGLKLDKTKTTADIIKAFIVRNQDGAKISQTVNLLVEVEEPKIKMAEVNDLGITSVLGMGISSFKYSHENRIKNIANAVKRLNGTLIKPDEEFSTNKYAGPYTTENGFLPEEVIIGDKIEIEVGGGMCQIGTTMFRMAMNSAMPITMRANHSLVVAYYSDPVNGNPGTDATLYEPFLDLRFKNDTGKYLLLQTAIDYENTELTFTLWGTSDGRKGSYTHPEVKEWIKPGKKKVTKTLELEEGKEKCQNAFTGAKASFTYTRFTSSSEKIEREFNSYYTPLPQICMKGVNKDEFCTENKDDTECKDYIPGQSSTSTIKES